MLDANEALRGIRWLKSSDDVNNVSQPSHPTLMIASWTNHSTSSSVIPSPDILPHFDAASSTPSTLVFKNASTSLHGSYACVVENSASVSSSNEVYVTIIQDSCSIEKSFETTSDKISCVEDITLYCRGFFPKPSPVCGLYNDVSGSYVQSVPFDRIEQSVIDGTYEISLFRRLHARDWLDYPGVLSFRCFVIVMSTSWRRGIHHRLFEESNTGCTKAPPEVTNGHYNYSSQQLSCWSTPKEGSRITYTCNQGYGLFGPESLVCVNGSWRETSSDARTLITSQIITGDHQETLMRKTVCDHGTTTTKTSSIIVLLSPFIYGFFFFLIR